MLPTISKVPVYTPAVWPVGIEMVPPINRISLPAVPAKLLQRLFLEVFPGLVQVSWVMTRLAPGPDIGPVVSTNCIAVDPRQELIKTCALLAPPREVTVPVTLTAPVSSTVRVPPAAPGAIKPNTRGWISVNVAGPGAALAPEGAMCISTATSKTIDNLKQRFLFIFGDGHTIGLDCSICCITPGL